MKCKKMFFLVAVVMSLLLAPISVSATSMSDTPVTSSVVDIQPFWDHVNSITVAISSSGSTATGIVNINAATGVTSIDATITLARVNANGSRTTVRTWTQNSTSSTLRFSDTHTITPGNTYRLTVSARVTRNNTTETANNWTERVL